MDKEEGFGKSFADLAADPKGTVYVDKTFCKGKVRVLVLRGPFSLCAYIGIPEDHPFAGKDYDSVNLPVHGGLTFGAKGGFGCYPAGWWWYGWDYGHWYDRSFYHLKHPIDIPQTEWTVPMVAVEVADVLPAFARLANSAIWYNRVILWFKKLFKKG